MAVELLGSETCIQSLSRDVKSIQHTVELILKKTGKLNYKSWKYPTKNASALDISELLDDYKFTRDEESNRLSHIILFELVIDRFCFLLQCVSKLFSQIINTCEDVEERPQSQTVTSTMSVGLVVKMFWKKFSQLENMVTSDKQSCVNDQSIKPDDELIEKSVKLPDINHSNKSILIHGKNNSINVKNEDSSHKLSYEEKKLKDVKTSTTQTYETAFLPCENCYMMKENLIRVGSSVINICESQSLPSSLLKQKRMVEEIDMNAKDIKRWSEVQSKDIDKINTYLTKQADENKTFHKKVEELSKENERLATLLSQKEIEYNSFNNVRDGLEKNMLQKSNENMELKFKLQQSDTAYEELKERNIQLETKLRGTTKDLDQQTKLIDSLEETKKMLLEKLNHIQKEYDILVAFKEESEKNLISNQALEQKLEEKEQLMLKMKTDFDKLSAENKVLLKHDESLQKKMNNLVSRLEKMEDEQNELTEEINLLKDENELLVSEKNKIIEENKQKLSNNDQSTDDLLYQLKLVINYPVFSKRYKEAEDDYKKLASQPSFQLDGNSGVDVVRDMKNQFDANDIRISVLKEENKMLEESLKKLNAEEDYSIELKDSGINNESVNLNDLKRSRNNSAPMSIDNNSQPDLHMPHPPSQPRSSKTPSRSRSAGKTEVLDISSKLAQLEKIRNSKRTSAAILPKPAWKQNEYNTSHEDPVRNVVCPDCDQKYLSEQDLDIHRSFCYGRI